MGGKRLAIIGNQAFSLLNFRGSLIRATVEQGNEVFAFSPDFDDVSRAAIRALGAVALDHKLERTGMNPIRDAIGVLDLMRKLRAIRPDVSLGYSIKPVTFGTIAAWLAGVPRRYAMIEGLGHVFIEPATVAQHLLRAAVTVLYRLSLGRAHRVFFLNPDDLAEFRRAGLTTDDSADLIGAIGVDLSKWAPAPPVTNPISFVFVGRMLKEKGVLELVEAMRLVRAQHPSATLALLGDVDTNPSSLARSDIEGWVDEGLLTWNGQVAVQPWIAKSSVFVLPSYREGMPRSTQEAMAMARPVITTDVPGCRETVIEGHNGFLIPARDSDALALAMLRFIEKPSLVASMGERSRAMAEHRFDERRFNADLMSRLGL